MRDEPIHPVPKPPKAAKRLARNRGNAAERVVAKRLGGRRVYKSGASPFEKGDVMVDDTFTPLFIETKYRSGKEGRKNSITFEWEWMEKTILDAQAVGAVPLVALRFAHHEQTIYCTLNDYVEHLVACSRVLKRIQRDHPEVVHEASANLLKERLTSEHHETSA